MQTLSYAACADHAPPLIIMVDDLGAIYVECETAIFARRLHKPILVGERRGKREVYKGSPAAKRATRRGGNPAKRRRLVA